MNKFPTAKFLQAAVFIAVSICFFNLPSLAQKNKPDKVKAVKTVTGKFVSFEQGDYFHADIKNSKGKTLSFWLGGERCLECFIALNQGKTMTFTYEIVDTYIPESGGRMVIERIKTAKAGSLTFEKWWKDLRKQYSAEQIENKYSSLVDKFTKN